MKKYLVIGNPIEHSLSPKLHSFWIKKNNIDAIYEKEEQVKKRQHDCDDKESLKHGKAKWHRIWSIWAVKRGRNRHVHKITHVCARLENTRAKPFY